MLKGKQFHKTIVFKDNISFRLKGYESLDFCIRENVIERHFLNISIKKEKIFIKCTYPCIHPECSL